jgi:zinc/manganese transport system substrate-binding protein
MILITLNGLRFLSPLLVVALAFGAAACDSGDAGDRPGVTATTGIWADVTKRVAGDDAAVEQVIPDGTSPHDFQLSAQDRAELEDSALLVSNGAELEAGIPIDEIDVREFAVADHAGELRRFEEGVDPHVWMDPRKVVEALPALADRLAEADPENATGYRARAADLAAELVALDREIRSMLAAVQPQNRKLVTSHDSLGYFADAYGFEVIATPFPASGPEAEASAETIAEVEEAVRDSGVPAVFAQETDNPEVLEGIASRTGVRIVDDLLVESPGDAGTYGEMLRRDAELIAIALAPSQG